MRDETGVRRVGIDVARQRAIDTLMEHFANEVLEMSEFERRLDISHDAVTEADLNKLVDDLPATHLPAPAPSVVPARGGAPVVVAADRVSERVYMVSLVGGVGVEVRLPGEIPWEAKKRRKLERKGLVPRLASPSD